MLNILEKRLNKVPLTKTQKKIADYFLKNQERLGNISSADIAKEIGVSDASIIRFSQAIGYDGFLELKNDIYNSMAESISEGIDTLDLSKRNLLVSAKYKNIDIVAEYRKIIEFNAIKTFSKNDEKSYQKTVDCIVKAQKKYIAGFRGCKGTVIQFARLLNYMTKNVVKITDYGTDTIGELQDMDEKDVLVLFVLPRYYKMDLRIAELAYNRKAKICLITDSPLAPMAKYADVLLLAEKEHIGFFNSTIGMNVICEYLLAKINYLYGESFTIRAEERDRITDDLRIKP